MSIGFRNNNWSIDEHVSCVNINWTNAHWTAAQWALLTHGAGGGD